LQNDSDKAFLNGHGFVIDAGFYSAAYRIVQMGLLPVVALTGSTHRRFLEDDADVPGTHIRRAVRFALPAISYSVLVAAVLWCLAPYLHFLLGDDFGPSVGMLRWLVLFLPLRASWTVALNALLGLDRPGLRTVVLIISAVISITLYAILVPLYSWKGAVIGTIASELLLAALCWMMVVTVQRSRDRTIDRERVGVAS
jgi:O-antigen/teichoic acid export membrane protein